MPITPWLHYADHPLASICRSRSGSNMPVGDTRGHFPSDESATKLIWLALRNITAEWSRASHDWKEAMNQFAILYAERFTEVPV